MYCHHQTKFKASSLVLIFIKFPLHFITQPLLVDGPTICLDSISTVSANILTFYGNKNITIICIPLGLHRDDCMYEDEDVTEAIRRLPRAVYDERNYRIMRALNLSMTKTILPKEQWTKYEEDTKYLEPYLKEVIKEREEREEWEKNK